MGQGATRTGPPGRGGAQGGASDLCAGGHPPPPGVRICGTSVKFSCTFILRFRGAGGAKARPGRAEGGGRALPGASAGSRGRERAGKAIARAPWMRGGAWRRRLRLLPAPGCSGRASGKAPEGRHPRPREGQKRGRGGDARRKPEAWGTPKTRAPGRSGGSQDEDVKR